MRGKKKVPDYSPTQWLVFKVRNGYKLANHECYSAAGGGVYRLFGSARAARG